MRRESHGGKTTLLELWVTHIRLGYFTGIENPWEERDGFSKPAGREGDLDEVWVPARNPPNFIV